MDDRSGGPAVARDRETTAGAQPAAAQSPGAQSPGAQSPGIQPSGTQPPGGLSGAEAEARLARQGPNALPAARATPLWRLAAGQLRDPLMLVLLVAAALTVATGDWTDAGVILLVVVVNTTAGVTQEAKAGQAIAALSRLTGPEARVLRDGAQQLIPAARVVTGDLLVLAEGDIVPADAEVLEAAGLLVDESALTGESVAVEKAPGTVSPVTGARADGGRRDSVSAGTTVVRGRGRAVVTATGTDSAMGRVASLLRAPQGLTPLQRRLAGLGRTLAVAAVALCAVVLVMGLARGQSAELMVVTAISLVVAAVPESLPAVVTLALALGARRMSARHALIRRLPAVETLGSVTVLGTDKTGTLTEGVMVVRRLWTPSGGPARVSGTGYAPHGEVARDGNLVTGDPAGDPFEDLAAGDRAGDLVALLTAGALCNDAALRPPKAAETADGTASGTADEAVGGTADGAASDSADGAADGGAWSAVGDPTEAALLAAAAKLGIVAADLASEFPRIGEVPFDSDRKRMTTVHRLPSGRVRVVCKGAPEVMLTPGVIAGTPEALAEASARAAELARGGHRVLAFAGAERPAVPRPRASTERGSAAQPGDEAGSREAGSAGEDSAGEDSAEADSAGLERGLRLLGLAALADPPRASAAATIASCRAAGITPVLITGDHPATAAAIAREAGIIGPEEEAVDCRLPGSGAAYAAGRVFARATPEQKLLIIAARQEAGDVVAMTGDGVNDGPALHRADIGVAMGGRGTEVARQAADMVLSDDELSTVTAAAEEGRRVYANIRRFLLYGLAGGSAEIAVMLLGPLGGLAVPLLPAQILWVNLLTHGLPGVALGSEPAEPGAMRRPPRPPAESVLGAGLWQRITRVGLVITAVTLGVALWGHATGRPWQSMAFFALGSTQLAAALGSRARPGTLANPALLWSVAGALGLQFAGLYVPFLNDLLKTRPLAWPDLLVVVVLSALGYAAIRLDRVLHADGRWRPRLPGRRTGEPEERVSASSSRSAR